jgi:predicted deacylase
MQKAYEIGPLRVEPGTRAQGWIELGRGVLGDVLGIPLIVLHGLREGKTVLVDAVTHGDEAEGPLGMLGILRDLDPEQMAGTLIAVPALNGRAFAAGTRGDPYEIHQYDLNRSYPGEPNGGITQRIAYAYMNTVVNRANAVVTLHGGGTPFYLDGFVIAQETSGDSLELVRAMGWHRFTDAPDTSVSAYHGTLTEVCHRFGIASITAEMGGAGFRSPQWLNRTKSEYMRGVRNVLIHYGLIEGAPDRPETLWKIRKHNQRSVNGGIIELAEGIDIESDVKEGQLLLRIHSIFGDVLEEHRAPFDGRVMGLPGSPMAFPARILSSVYSVEEEIPTAPSR